MKQWKRVVSVLAAVTCLVTSALAATHTVQPGDTMWKIAVRYEVGTAEIIEANPQVENPNLIYPGEKLSIPEQSSAARYYEQEVIRLVNAERTKRELTALAENWELSRVARYKSQDMHDNRYFDHNSPIYGSPFNMIHAFGLKYRSAGENIAAGYTTPAAVVRAWMNSEGHRANILNATYREIGVGYIASGNYCTQMFIS